MKVFLTITGEINDFWATPEQLQELSDAEIIELIKEDPSAFYEDAAWEVTREMEPDEVLARAK